ncbi:tudor domain-containing protein 7B [Toxorhynchites rutilus septentrionalis]|uniref:tudor domain-containing protein 7B n=1 Tax=Toxorhynchites rutilus septentrionalis TaxID=329112 RepID=UPI00247A1C72|nr:tudor domain-containing protein 7B [Toxorhynchites rutilus septentrionalis]
MAHSPKKELSEEAEAAINVLRALVSSKKGPSTVYSILRDYRELEGGPLLYKKFGYPNPEKFLEASGEFSLSTQMGETVMYAKPNKESVHILKMVAAQRNTKTKKSGFSILRQPQKRIGGNNWNPSAYNKMYSQMPQTNRFSPKKYTPQAQNQHQQRYNSPNNQPKPFFQAMSNGPRWQNTNRTSSSTPNNSPLKPLMSLRISPPLQQHTQSNNQYMQNNQRYNRTETNNNNSTVKNLNRSTQSPVKTGQQPLASNDLRHKLSDKQSVQLKQPSSLELKNQLNNQQPQTTRVVEQRNNAIQKMVCDAVTNNYAQPAISASVIPQPVLQSTRSVNSRLQITKEVIPVPAKETIKSSQVQFDTNEVFSPRHELSSPSQSVIYPVILTPPTTPVVQLPILPFRKSLQDRLKINQQVDVSDLEKVSKVITPQSPPPKAADFDSKLPLLPSNPSAGNRPREAFSWNQPHATPAEMLVSYAEHNGLERPIYNYLKLKNKRVQCRVTVNKSTYSTYPDDFMNEFEGQFAAAQIAIENLKREEERNNFSVCLESDFEIATKIFDLLVNCPHGMFRKNIPDAFRNAHHALLPDNWELIILENARMFSKEEAQGNTIVFANVREGTGSGGSTPSITSEAKCMSANVLPLPWKEQYWNLYITNPVSTVEIWARLVGPQYSDQMDIQTTDIELSMMGEMKPKPKTIAVGEYYLVSITDCWYRVRVEEIDFENNNCSCFFIDIGEWERVSLDEIYVCDAKYLELPGQSVCFTLDGLEDFGENPKAKPHLNDLLNGKVCISEILTSEEEHEKDSKNNLNEARIRMILYDTSFDEDINLNSMLLKHICDDTPAPELDRKCVTTVSITHVDEIGNVYCYVKDLAMVYIQKLINSLVQSDALEGKHRGLYKSRSAADQRLYLVQDESDNKWYRASLIAEESGPFCRVLLVDVGVRKLVNISNIYRLETLSVALSRYPPQNIRMKMFDLPEINDYILGRLRALLTPGQTAMVKVAACSTIPLVKIYMHLDQNNILVCVNNSIRSEMELEIDSEVISDPRITYNESSSSSTTSSAKINTSYTSDYSMHSLEAADLSKHFSGLKIGNRKLGSPIPSMVAPKLAKFQLPAVGDLFEVQVTIASNPKFFFVQPYAHAIHLNRMMVDLQKYCMSKAQVVSKDSVQQGEVYAALNSDDGYWYRAIVVNILCGPTIIHVYFCDFGQIKIMDSDSLRILPQQLRVLPQQAVKAKLHGVQPLHGDWTAEDAVRFQQLTENKKFASYIRSVQADEFNQHDDIVELELIDVSTEEDILIHQIFVDEKRAVLTGGK